MSGIIIHRSHHAQQYVVVPNAIARNARLSFTARGLLAMLLSLPPEWHVTTDMLAEDNPDSRTAIRKAMAELRELGYVEVHHEQDGGGRWRSDGGIRHPANRTRAGRVRCDQGKQCVSAGRTERRDTGGRWTGGRWSGG